MDIHQLILLQNKRIILNKKFYDGEDISAQLIPLLRSYIPNLHCGDKKIVSINRGGILYVISVPRDFCPIYGVEVLQRFYDLICVIIKSSDVNDIISKNFFINDILDKYMENGLVQLTNTHQIQFEDLNLKSPLPLDKSSFNTSIPLVDAEEKCNVYIDVIERCSIIINENDSIIQFNLIGQVNFKCEYFKYLTDFAIQFKKILIQSGPTLGFERIVTLRKAIFNKIVDSQKFFMDQIIGVCPSEEESVLMTYEANDSSQRLPIRVYTKIKEDTNKNSILTVILRAELLSNDHSFNNLKCCLHTSDQVIGADGLAGEDGQRVECSLSKNRLCFFVKTLKGKETSCFNFKLSTKAGEILDRSQLGPLGLDFEIAGYPLSGISIKNLVFNTTLPKSEKWIRYATLSDTYIIDLNL